MGRLADYQTFLTQFFRHYQTTGAVLPSGRALASSLCRHVGRDGPPQKILEAGPGTGAVTSSIIQRMRPEDRLWMVELNPAFNAHLRRAFEQQPLFREAADRCHLVEGPVQQLGSDGAGTFDLVVSGLPLNNFTCDDVRTVLETYGTLLKPGGVLSFFEYIMIRPAKMLVSNRSERTRLKGVGREIEGMLGRREFSRDWVWGNVPPAWVHHTRF